MSQSISISNHVNTKGRPAHDDGSVAVQPKHVKEVFLHNKKTDHVEAQEVQTIVDKLNDFIDPAQTNLKFVFHEQLNEYYVTVIDPITKETIKEIPSKKLLDTFATMAEQMGLLIDRKI